MSDFNENTFVELWADVVGYEGSYQVSNLGRVKSLRRTIIKSNGTFRIINERIMQLPRNVDGYLLVTLYLNGVGTTYNVHNLVLNAFVGSKPKGFECNHKNYKRDDNRLENIEWCSRQENSDHKNLNNRNNGYVNSNKRKKLTPKDIHQIRSEYKAIKGQQTQLAQKYNVSQQMISEIVNNISWSL